MLLSFVRVFLGALPLIYVGFIWCISSHPSDAIIDTGLSFDGKLKETMHFVEFGVLYILIVLGLKAFGKLTQVSNRWAVFVALFCGLVDELHQYYVPSRSATVNDLVKDFVGVTVAWFIIDRLFFAKKKNIEDGS